MKDMHNSTNRIKYGEIAPEGIAILGDLEKYIKGSGLEPKLLELVKLRASQINGCAFCIDMHTKDARSQGESEQRLYGLNAWRETPFYSERERAALAWTESVTRIGEHRFGRGHGVFFKEGAGGPDFGRNRHQLMESPGYQFSYPSRLLSARPPGHQRVSRNSGNRSWFY